MRPRTIAANHAGRSHRLPVGHGSIQVLPARARRILTPFNLACAALVLGGLALAAFAAWRL